jgi:hypothetical protein
MLASGITEKAVPHLLVHQLSVSLFRGLTCLCYSHQAHRPFLGSLRVKRVNPSFLYTVVYLGLVGHVIVNKHLPYCRPGYHDINTNIKVVG